MSSFKVSTAAADQNTRNSRANYKNISPDLLLQASRRLDWRFLFHSPELDRVAYSGREEGSLWESLKMFSHTLTRLEYIQGTQVEAEAYDVVITKNPSSSTLAWAAGVVSPGGYLYMESFGWTQMLRTGWLLKHWKEVLLPTARSARPSDPSRFIAALRQCGFKRINAFWHWPNFESCTKIISLDDPNVLSLALSSSEGRIQAILQEGLRRRWLSPDRIAKFVPCFSLVARRDPA